MADRLLQMSGHFEGRLFLKAYLGDACMLHIGVTEHLLMLIIKASARQTETLAFHQRIRFMASSSIMHVFDKRTGERLWVNLAKMPMADMLEQC